MSNIRYHIDFDRMANMLTPSYIRKKLYVLLFQSMLSPLQSLNERFVRYTEEHRIEASMTSQVILFEWYLNRKFSQYFVDPLDRITLDDPIDVVVPVYRKADPNLKPCTIWNVGGDWSGVKGTEEEPKVFFYKAENKTINETSFTVSVPAIKIKQEDFVPMLSAVVNRYKIAGKTFRIKITDTE